MADNSKEILILGNGISRSEHQEFIDNWTGEIWACNWAFHELIDGTLHRIDKLIGDKKALIKALQAQKKHNLKFEPICKGEPKDELSTCTPASKYGLSKKRIFDSGTALVEMALIAGYEKIYLAGFDLGGKDIYISEHEKRNKGAWIRKWRMIDQEYGLDRIEFLGNDHKWFIKSELPIDYYARFYTRGLNHLTSVNLNDTKYYDSVIILENGKSRLRYNQYLQKWDKELWVMDRGFIEYNALPTIHRVGTIQQSVAKEAQSYKEKKGLNYEVYARDFIDGYEDKIHVFKELRGWLAGPLMVAQAIKEGYESIYLVGFDIGEEDLYGKNTLKSRNYVNQLLTVKKEKPKEFKERVHLLDNAQLNDILSQDD